MYLFNLFIKCEEVPKETLMWLRPPLAHRPYLLIFLLCRAGLRHFAVRGTQYGSPFQCKKVFFEIVHRSEEILDLPRDVPFFCN